MVLNTHQVYGVFLVCLCSAVHAQTSAKETLPSTIPKGTLQSYQTLKSLEKKLLSALDASDQKRKKLERNIQKVRGDLTQKNQELNELTQKRQRLETEIGPLEAKVRERLKARQVSLKRGEAFIRLLLQEGGATRFMTARGYLNAIAAQDLKLMRAYHMRKRLLLKNEAKTKASTHVLKSLEVELADKAVEIDRLNQERFVLLERAKRQKRSAEKTARRLGLGTALRGDTVREQNFLKSKGKMPRPVKGRLFRTFGTYKSPRFKTRHRSDGWWFNMGRTSPVQSIAAGKVIYSGPFNGYGTLVIVEHTARFHSVYGLLDETTVSVNQEIQSGDRIGQVTKSKGNRRPRLYFEIRKDKKPTDPIRYLVP